MKALLVCATRWEVLPLWRHVPMRSFGMGSRRAEMNMRDIFAREIPRRIILAGFSGGVNSDQRTGDIALPGIFCDEVGHEIALPVAKGLREDLLQDGIVLDAGVRQISVERVADPTQKFALGQRWPNACGVDMESFTVAHLCKEHGVPMTCVRVIFDAVGARLPSMGSFLRLPFWYRLAASNLARAVRCVLRYDFDHAK